MAEVHLKIIDAQEETLRKDWTPETGSRFVAKSILEVARQIVLLREEGNRTERVLDEISMRLRELRDQARTDSEIYGIGARR
jgi:hypothetical protein